MHRGRLNGDNPRGKPERSRRGEHRQPGISARQAARRVVIAVLILAITVGLVLIFGSH